MARSTKRMKKLNEIADPSKKYNLKEGVSLVKKTASSKFDETIDLSIKLGLSSKEASQPVRGTVALPHGTGKKVRTQGRISSAQKT